MYDKHNGFYIDLLAYIGVTESADTDIFVLDNPHQL